MSDRSRKTPPETPDTAQKKSITKDDAAAKSTKSADAVPPNPPRTTTAGWLTTPKFGSAGSGGAELEPGPERD
jgi:hypothetical protein